MTSKEDDPIGARTANFGATAKSLARNPLGIVALFIVLVYAMALVALFAPVNHKLVIVCFLVLFPVLVLAVFAWLVAKHHHKLYAPRDFRDDQSFLHIAANLWAAEKKLKNPLSSPISPVRPTPQSQPAASDEHSVQLNRILWVDDNPENNQFERQAFEAAGLRVSLALSTNEALERLAQDRYVAVVSDMARQEGPREGYVLLDTLRAQGNDIPLYFYASSSAPEHKRETREHGGQGCTNDPIELFEMVMRPHYSSKPYYRLTVSPDGKRYSFTLHAPNHQIVLLSESYSKEEAVLHAIAVVRETAATDDRYVRVRSADGRYAFRLVARNGQVLATSELYDTEEQRDQAAFAIGRYAQIAELRSETR